jgi:hypothetical protein
MAVESPVRPCRGAEADGERSVRGHHRAWRQAAFESRIEPSRHDVVVHDVGDHGRGRCGARNRRRLVHVARRAFEPRRPEQGTRVMDAIAHDGVPKRRAPPPLGAVAPQPMAGGVGRGADRT